MGLFSRKKSEERDSYPMNVDAWMSQYMTFNGNAYPLLHQTMSGNLETIGQGFDMGRPSVLQASAEKKAGTVVACYIGGRCVPMMSGVLEID